MLPGIGIFGIEESNSILIKKFQENSFRIYGICGPDISKLTPIANNFNIEIVTSKVEDLLLHTAINLIVFVKYIPNFADHVCKALTVAGKHVICCSGFAVSAKQGQDMYEASLKYPTLLSLIENPLRFSTNFSVAKSLMAKKAIGQVYINNFLPSFYTLIPLLKRLLYFQTI
uniref:Glucose-fructose oxidoreductase domain-containing protein 2 (Trinotate prediction) n=1 Tax=Henneguya salminicola TaxID=69463 RepID=A0A6G3MIF2_HENSL